MSSSISILFLSALVDDIISYQGSPGARRSKSHVIAANQYTYIFYVSEILVLTFLLYNIDVKIKLYFQTGETPFSSNQCRKKVNKKIFPVSRI